MSASTAGRVSRSARPEAIFYEDDLPKDQSEYLEVNAEFFAEIGSPGGAAKFGVVDYDHPVVVALPPQE